jgi:hypothetical protein
VGEPEATSTLPGAVRARNDSGIVWPRRARIVVTPSAIVVAQCAILVARCAIVSRAMRDLERWS